MNLLTSWAKLLISGKTYRDLPYVVSIMSISHLTPGNPLGIPYPSSRHLLYSTPDLQSVLLLNPVCDLHPQVPCRGFAQQNARDHILLLLQEKPFPYLQLPLILPSASVRGRGEHGKRRNTCTPN